MWVHKCSQRVEKMSKTYDEVKQDIVEVEWKNLFKFTKMKEVRMREKMNHLWKSLKMTNIRKWVSKFTMKKQKKFIMPSNACSKCVIYLYSCG